MKLQQLIHQFDIHCHQGDLQVPVCAIVDDSRQVTRGALFVARAGSQTDGASFIHDALERGAVAILASTPPTVAIPNEIVVLVSPDPSAIAPQLAERFYDHPAAKLKMIAITGTNGKTTTAFMIRHLLNTASMKCGLVGTIHIDDGQTQTTAELTTPGALQLTAILARMVANNCKACVLEASSHALDQNRVNPKQFKAALFTNLTGDHLDYHQTMERYADAKAVLFEGLGAGAIAVVNAQDPAAQRMLRDTSATSLSFAIDDQAVSADINATITQATARYTDCQFAGPWGSITAKMPIAGRYNAANMAAALGGVHALGVDVATLAPAIENCPPIPGRLHPISPNPHDFDVFVDYAHTDDALANALESLRPLTRNKLRVLFGCGGDRDPSKRPRMAQAAASIADEIVITSDNPRTESPKAIIDDILQGVGHQHEAQTQTILDRADAIAKIVADAQAGDVILLAGKGHEDYQIIGCTKTPFDDTLIAQQAIDNYTL